MVKGLLATQSLGWVEAKHLGEEVNSEWVGLWVKRREGDLRLNWERSNVVLGTRTTNPSKGILRRRSEVMKNLVELIDVVSTLVNGFSSKEFSKDTANGPNVNSCGIVCETQHNLWSSVPPSGYIFGHEALVACCSRSTPAGGVASSKTEIADLEFTIGIDEKISGFEISVKDVCRMDVLQSTEGLINEGLEMGIGKRLARPDNCMEIGFHELFIKVHFIKIAARLEYDIHVVQTCNVFVSTEMVKQPDLSKTPLGQDTLSVDVSDFLDSASFTRSTMSGGYYTTISALTEFLYELIFRVDDESRVEGGEAMSLHIVDGRNASKE